MMLPRSLLCAQACSGRDDSFCMAVASATVREWELTGLRWRLLLGAGGVWVWGWAVLLREWCRGRRRELCARGLVPRG